MGRYSQRRLQAMAKTCLRARSTGDPRWMELVLRISMIHGYDPHDVMERIEKLAGEASK